MFCSRCGSEITGKSKFCPSCGLDLMATTPVHAIATGGMEETDLVREALARFDEAHGLDERAKSLRAIDGLWKNWTDLPDTETYVRRLRRDVRFLDA